MRLGDLGERRILKEIIPRFVMGVGDDCADVGVIQGSLVVTTDPVPRPAASVVANDADLYWLGWLLVTINASDIAAAGARPHSFLAALDLPTDLDIGAFERLLQGIHDSCEANHLAYVGGNLREADKISAVGTAIGASVSPPLKRAGATAGDYLVVIGEGGRFWADCERFERGIFIEKSTSPLFSPISQAPHVWKANEAGLLRCAMDTSDGLAPSLVELSQVNSLGLDIDLTKIRESSDFSDVFTRTERLWMGWGDWTVIAAVKPENLNELVELINDSGSKVTPIGQFVVGKSVRLVDDNRSIEIPRLESERFSADSWFSAGIAAYIKLLREFPLP